MEIWRSTEENRVRRDKEESLKWSEYESKTNECFENNHDKVSDEEQKDRDDFERETDVELLEGEEGLFNSFGFKEEEENKSNNPEEEDEHNPNQTPNAVVDHEDDNTVDDTSTSELTEASWNETFLNGAATHHHLNRKTPFVAPATIASGHPYDAVIPTSSSLQFTRSSGNRSNTSKEKSIEPITWLKKPVARIMVPLTDPDWNGETSRTIGNSWEASGTISGHPLMRPDLGFPVPPITIGGNIIGVSRRDCYEESMGEALRLRVINGTHTSPLIENRLRSQPLPDLERTGLGDGINASHTKASKSRKKYVSSNSVAVNYTTRDPLSPLNKPRRLRLKDSQSLQNSLDKIASHNMNMRAQSSSALAEIRNPGNIKNALYKTMT